MVANNSSDLAAIRTGFGVEEEQEAQTIHCITPLYIPHLSCSWYRITRISWEMDKNGKTHALKECTAICRTQKWTSYMHNAGTEVLDGAKAEYNMHKKKLRSTDTTVYVSMCMMRDMGNACLCRGKRNYSLLDDLIDTFENAHKKMSGHCDRELVPGNIDQHD